MTISNYGELAFLDTLRNVSFAVASPYIKLHLGDPGEAGTANPAAETTRKAVSFSAASSGSMASSATVTGLTFLTRKPTVIGRCGMLRLRATACGRVLFHLRLLLPLATLFRSLR